jgi:hypothetical protein
MGIEYALTADDPDVSVVVPVGNRRRREAAGLEHGELCRSPFTCLYGST